jgi:5-methylcytosine-specific restriction protein A
MRAALFRAQPFCQQCLTQGHRTVATIRDHIVPLAEGGTDTVSNTQGLCQMCSDRKTHAEARRGAIRANGIR